MNERIKELAEQAMESTGVEGLGGSYMELNTEKFAELIVRKCAMFCNDISEEAWKSWKTKYDPHDDGRSSGAEECEYAIRKYFGVEE